MMPEFIENLVIDGHKLDSHGNCISIYGKKGDLIISVESPCGRLLSRAVFSCEKSLITFCVEALIGNNPIDIISRAIKETKK